MLCLVAKKIFENKRIHNVKMMYYVVFDFNKNVNSTKEMKISTVVLHSGDCSYEALDLVLIELNGLLSCWLV